MQTAYEIESRLLTLKDLTLITITHNMSEDLLKQYDEIFYMENGQVAERGTLQELLRFDGGFKRFYTLEREQTPPSTREEQLPLPVASPS
ncbi:MULTISPECIES: hypothetical protein [Paenibacillus]|uniref:hypothetical protein n=1 Tax=Paenibacillus TaxID=44249 RepID=UPI002FE297F1